jgi:hypothetical protein
LEFKKPKWLFQPFFQSMAGDANGTEDLNGAVLLPTLPNIPDPMSLPSISQEPNALVLLELTFANFILISLTFDVAEEIACPLPLGSALCSIFQQK